MCGAGDGPIVVLYIKVCLFEDRLPFKPIQSFTCDGAITASDFVPHPLKKNRQNKIKQTVKDYMHFVAHSLLPPHPPNEPSPEAAIRGIHSMKLTVERGRMGRGSDCRMHLRRWQPKITKRGGRTDG